MHSETIRLEMTFEEACQVQHALEQRVEASTTAFQAMAAMLPEETRLATLEQIGAANRALDKLQRSLIGDPRRFYVRAG